MKNELRGFTKVFRFTVNQHIKIGKFFSITLILAIICFALPLGIMAISANSALKKSDAPVSLNNIDKVFFVDTTEGDCDPSTLSLVGDAYDKTEYVGADSLDDAVLKAENEKNSLILLAENDDSAYNLTVLIPDGSELNETDAEAYKGFIDTYFRLLLIQKSGLDFEDYSELIKPTIYETPGNISDSETPEDPVESVRSIISMIMPYITIMLLYFMILFYGQGVATSIVSEKTSKLMDTFLVSVKPSALIMGKMFAMALCGLTQLLLWAISLVGGFAAGYIAAHAIDPATDIATVRFIQAIGSMSGIFTWQSLLFTAIILIFGFLLYCSLAAVGGALAGKPEDLSSTNLIFTMALVISFLATIYSGALTGDLSQITWQLYVPFTSILITPSLVMLGEISILQAIISASIVALTSVVVILISGRIYKAMIMFKGNPPGLHDLFNIIKNKEA